MSKIGYILHRFPSKTDTFIRREIACLRLQKLDVEVISVWRPKPDETDRKIIEEWQFCTRFLLPAPSIRLIIIILRSILFRPNAFFRTLSLAWKTRVPGLRGTFFQGAYLLEALLAANIALARNYRHLHNHIGDQSGTVTMLTACYSKLPFSISIHGWPVFFDAKNARVKEKVTSASFTRCISYFCRSQIMMLSGIDNCAKLEVIHCGLDLSKYPYRKPKKKVTTLFCVARLSPEKGIKTLISAVNYLVKNGHDLNLKLAGDGPSMQDLVDFCAELQLGERVSFLGFRHEAEVVSDLNRSDIFILPSFVEGLPVSVMEAMAVGVPVIATNVGGTSELVIPGKTGLLVQPSNVEDLVNAAEIYLGDFDLRKRISLEARTKVEAEFELDCETAKLAKCFSNLVEENNN